MYTQLLLASWPILIIIVLAILSTMALIKRDDLSRFQLWSMFLLSWFIPLIGPLVALITLSFVVPRSDGGQ